MCYHKVNDHDRDYMTVSVQNFKAQMEFLNEQGYEMVSLNELVKGTGDKGQGARVVITFDDGYEDIYQNAFPVMKQYGFKGIVFLIVEQVGGKGFLSRDHILEMAKAGFEFGSHTLSHAELTKADDGQKKKEIMGSKKMLEQNLGIPIRFFCYPRGLYDKASVQLVKDAGYLGACSNVPGANGKGLNAFLLRRTEVAPHDTLFDFEKKLAGAYDLLHQVLHAARGRP